MFSNRYTYVSALAIIERFARKHPGFLLGLVANEEAGMLTLFANVLTLRAFELCLPQALSGE